MWDNEDVLGQRFRPVVRGPGWSVRPDMLATAVLEGVTDEGGEWRKAGLATGRWDLAAVGN